MKRSRLNIAQLALLLALPLGVSQAGQKNSVSVGFTLVTETAAKATVPESGSRGEEATTPNATPVSLNATRMGFGWMNQTEAEKALEILVSTIPSSAKSKSAASAQVTPGRG